MTAVTAYANYKKYTWERNTLEVPVQENFQTQNKEISIFKQTHTNKTKRWKQYEKFHRCGCFWSIEHNGFLFIYF